MKRIIKISAIVLAVVFSQTACEKDSSAPANKLNDNNINQTKKAISPKDKSGFDNYFQAMLPYASKIIHDSVPNTVDAHLALLYMEAATNYEKGHLGQDGNVSEVIEFTTSINLVQGPTSIEVSGDEALSYFNTLKSEIDNIYNNSNLYATYGSAAYIDLVDIEFGDANLRTGHGVINGTAILKVELEPSLPYCDIVNDWRALDLLGLCNNPNQYDADAAVRIETNLNNSHCNGKPCSNSFVFVNAVLKTKNGFQSNLIWNGNSPSDCITASQIKFYRSGAQTEANNMTPNPLPQGWITSEPLYFDYSIDKLIQGNFVAHRLTVAYVNYWCWMI